MACALLGTACQGVSHRTDTAVGLYTPPASEQSIEPPKPNLPSFDICLKSLDQRVPVIMYHDVVEDRGPGTVWFDCTVAEFEDQVRTIKSRGYTPVSLDQLHQHLTAGTDLPPKAIVLTFDDNYQGFYDYAWPILKQERFPVAMFVHTGFVGKKTGREHMSWQTLKKLCSDPLFTVGSHTVSHPDMTTLDGSSVAKELGDSKADLEQHLGRTIDYFAYPDGRNNADVQMAVREAGYKMAVTMENGPAEESPGIECVNRYIQTRMDRAMDEAEQHALGSVGVYVGPLKGGPVAYREQVIAGKTLALVSGGVPVSITSGTREGVLDFIHRTTGAVAGINGTFFDMAAISSTDNKLVGPCKTAADSAVIPDVEPDRWPKIRNRPVIVWGPTQVAIYPYDPPRMNDDQAYRDVMPDVTDVFLAGAWLVHGGKALIKEQMELFASKDIEDPRRRAAFGFMADGTPVAAASKDSVSSADFADMLSQAGVQEAVLLDSGFSTSLVYGEKIMASGHSRPNMPSRPVPHAIIFKGDLDPASQAVAAAAVPATDPVVVEATSAHPKRHRRRHRRAVPTTEEEAPATVPAPDATPPPDTTPPP
jgi:peptidoglycan/xylan/chitin deacetylase (PgdA/CDA1 family)